jgi:GAF domain-containing protein
MATRAASAASYARLEALYEVSRALNSTLDLAESLSIVLDSAIRLTGAERGFLMLVEEASGEIHFSLGRSAEREPIYESEFEISRSVLQEVARSAEPVVTLNAQKDPRFDKKSSVVNFALRSIMAVPLRTRARVVGVLYVDSKSRAVEFGQADLDLLMAFADQAATAIVNAQLFEAQKRDADIRRVQLDVARVSQAAGTAQELAQALAASLPGWLNCDQVGLYLWDAEAKEFRLTSLSRDTKPLIFRVLEVVWANAAPWKARLQTETQPFALTADEVSQLLPLDEWALPPYPLLAIPLRAEKDLMGVLTLDNSRRRRAFTALTFDVAKVLGQQVANALQQLRLFETAQRQLEELTVLHAVAVAASEAVSVDELIERVTGAINETFRTEGFGVLLVDEAENVLRPLRLANAELAQQFTFPLDRGIVGHVARTGQSRRAADVTQDPLYVNLLNNTRSELCVPLKVGERVLGVINLESPRLNAFTASDERLMMTIAGQLATAIEKLRLLEDERQQRELAEALRDVGLMLNLELGIEEVLGRLLDQISRVVPYDAACVQLIENGFTRMIGLRGYERFGDDVFEATRTLRLEVARTANIRRMLETGQPAIVPDVLVDDRWENMLITQYLRSWVGAPIFVQGQCVAYLSLDKVEPRFYRPEHAQRLAAFAGQAALILQNVGLFQAAERRAAELDAVRSASLSLTSSLDLPVVLDAILDGVFTLLAGVEDAHIFIYDSGRLVFGAALWADGRRNIVYSEPRPDGLTYTVARQGEPIIVPNLREHSLFASAPPHWEGAIIGLPLKFGARVVGVMNVGYLQPRLFSESEIRILRLLGEQAAVAIENARLFEAARRQVEELGVLHSVATAGAESTSVDVLIERATRLIGETLKANHFGVMLLDEGGLVLQPHSSYRGRAAEDVPIGEGVSGQVAAAGRPWRSGDVRREPTHFGVDMDTLSALCVPLKVSDHVIGVVNVESDLLNAFTEDDERLLATFAGQLATAIEKARLFESERAARAQAETLRDVAGLLNSTLDREQLFGLILDQLARLVEYDSASIMLVEEDRLRIVVQRGFRSEEQMLTPFQMANLQHIQAVLEDRQPLMIANTSNDSRWRVEPGSEYIQCWLGVPLVAKEHVIGVLNLDKDEPGFYTSHHADLALALANQAAVALERLRLLAETQQHERELSFLLDVARAVSSSLDLDAVIKQVALSMVRALEVDACAVSAYDSASRCVRTVGWHVQVGPDIIGQMASLYSLADYPLTAEVIDRETLVVTRVSDPDADRAEAALLRGMGYSVSLMLSVRAGGRPVGLLELYTQDARREFTLSDLSLARAVADQTGVALENARLFQAEREQRELAEALRDAASILSASLDFEMVLDRLLDQIARVVPYDAACIFLSEAGRALTVRRRGYERFGQAVDDEIHTLSLEIARTPNLRRMIETGQPLVIADVEADPDWIKVKATQFLHSWAGAPIVAFSQTIALFSLDKIEPGFYQAKHAQQLSAFAGQAALALQNARLFETERRRVNTLTALHDISLELSAQLDRSALLLLIMDGAMRLLGAEMCLFYAVHPSAPELELIEARNVPDKFRGLRFRIGEGVSGQAALRDEPMVVDDYAVWPHRLSVFDELESRAVLSVPIKWQGQLRGVITILDRRAGRFNEVGVDVISLFADQAAIALENVRLYDALADEKQRLELLYNLSQNLAATLSAQEVALRAMDLMRAALGALKAAMWALDSDGGALRLIRLSGYAELTLETLEAMLPVGRGIVGQAAQSRQLVITSDVADDPYWVTVPHLDDGIRSAVAVPLLAGDELVGVLSLVSDREHFFQAEQLPLLRAAAAPMALALQNARLFEAEAQRAQYLALLNEITRAAVAVQEMPTLLQTLADRMGELTHADACYLTLWDDDRQQPIPAAAYGHYRLHYNMSSHYAPGMITMTESVLRAGRPLVADDIHNSPYIHPRLAEGVPDHSMLGLPLVAGDQRLGAALVSFNRPHHFTEEEMRRSEQAAGQIALALARARLFEATRRHADELAVASDILRLFSTTASVIHDFPAIASGLKNLVHCAHASMGLLTSDRQAFKVAGFDQHTRGPEAELRIQISAPEVWSEVIAGKALLLPDLSPADIPRYPWAAGVAHRSQVTLPLRGGQNVIGYLTLLWAETAGYASANMTLLNQIADALALAVEKERLFDETRRRAEELEAITSVSAALRVVETPADVMALLLRRSLEVFRADGGTIMAPEADEAEMRVVCAEGRLESVLGRRLPMKRSIAGHVFRTGEPYSTADVLNDPLAHTPTTQAWLNDARPQAALYAPLRSGEAVIGIVSLTAVAPRPFTEADVRLLTAIAEVGGNALQRARVLETLEQRVAERTRELEQANERLQELDRLKDVFVSTVSHELRTPLTAIKLHLGLLEKRGAELLPRYLPVLQRETERLRRLIEDLLDLSRLRAQTAPLKREPHPLDALIADVLALHSTRAEEREVTLVHHSAPDLPPVPVDQAQIVQVLTNLVINAMAYSPRGASVTVTSQRLLFGELEGVAVRVHNDGPPIPVEDRPYLFSRFYRGQTARDSGEPGTGLGLAISKEIVDRHGGYIEVESADGLGTTFMIWLPLARGEPEAE